MLTVKEKGILLYIINHCKRIETTIDGINEDNFYSNDDLKEIVCFNLLQIGELTNNLSSDFTNKYNGVPWDKIRGMRNRIAHGYGVIQINRVWQTAFEDIKPLREYCEAIILNDN